MRPTVENPSGSKRNKHNKLSAALATGLSLVALTACGETVTTAEPTPEDTPTATSTADGTPTETTSVETPTTDVSITSSPTETQLPPEITTTEPAEPSPVNTESNPNVHSFDKELPQHLRLDRETVQGWIENDDLESIANAIALETLNASENTWYAWVDNCKVDFIDASTSIWKSVDNMTGPELACQGMIGGGFITTATTDGVLYPDDIADTPHDKERAAVLADLTFGYWGAKDKANYGKAAHSEFLLNSQKPFNDKNSIAMADYGYTSKAMKVAEGEVDINGQTYKTTDIQMGNILQEHTAGNYDTAVIQFLRVPVTKAWVLDSEWEKWGGSKGDGSMRADENGNPLTLDGGPVEVLVPYQTIGTFDSK